jgi:hypothetical protein
MTPYYLLMPREGFGGANTRSEHGDDRRTLAQKLCKSGRIHDQPELEWFRDDHTPPADWVWGLRGIPLLSDAFREVIDSHLTPSDDLQWLPMTLVTADGAAQRRWVAHFPGERDILDVESTEWGPSGLPTLWYLSPTKMAGIAVTTLPNVMGDLIVNGDVMRALRRAKLTGYRTMRARVAGE